MKKLATMRDALADPALLGDALPGDSWFGWRTLLIASMGEPWDRKIVGSEAMMVSVNSANGARRASRFPSYSY